MPFRLHQKVKTGTAMQVSFASKVSPYSASVVNIVVVVVEECCCNKGISNVYAILSHYSLTFDQHSQKAALVCKCVEWKSLKAEV